jgi:hypothetical protein
MTVAAEIVRLEFLQGVSSADRAPRASLPSSSSSDVSAEMHDALIEHSPDAAPWTREAKVRDGGRRPDRHGRVVAKGMARVAPARSAKGVVRAPAWRAHACGRRRECAAVQNERVLSLNAMARDTGPGNGRRRGGSAAPRDERPAAGANPQRTGRPSRTLPAEVGVSQPGRAASRTRQTYTNAGTGRTVCDGGC